MGACCGVPAKPVQLFLLGLEGAGKSTMLKTWSSQLGPVQTQDIGGTTVERMQFKNIDIAAWDVGNREKSKEDSTWRNFWDQLTPRPEKVGLMFVVNASDFEDEAKTTAARDALQQILQQRPLWDRPVLCFVNRRQTNHGGTRRKC